MKVMQEICRVCFAELSEDDIRQLREIDMGIEKCWKCLERDVWGMEPVKPHEKHGERHD